MDRATISLIISILALLLAASRWIYDLRREQTGRQSRRRKRRGTNLRVEFLEGQTNCFITYGGYLLFLVSCRIYNDSGQASASIQACQFQAKIGRKWRDTELYEAPQAALFPSLFRNSLPVTLKPDERQDFYEVFALDELIPGTEIKCRLKVTDKNGKATQCQETFKHRLSESPVFDILFRVFAG